MTIKQLFDTQCGIIWGMADVQEMLEALLLRGWTISSIADALGSPRNTVERWKRGVHQPTHPQAIGLALEQLLGRKRIPKRKRYTKEARPSE